MEVATRANGFRVIALPVEVADQVRRTMVAPGYGHPAHVDHATGYGPCRVCLRTFAVKADRRILFTHDPFHGLEPYPLPGPIYVHAKPCRRYPETAGFPEDLRSIPITLNGYVHVRNTEAGCYIARVERAA